MGNAALLKPLAGVRVLDFTVMPPGGACTVMLADIGAEIIRVEPPAQKGKPSLVIGQVALSRAKRSITLDLRNPKSTEVLMRVLPGIDVIVENAKPGAMEARGFGYRQASAVNPRLIWCAMTGFGQDGPLAEHSGHDLSYLAHSGLLGALTADRNWHPGLPLSLQAGALAAVIGIQAALISRSQSGKGAFIDLSLSEAATWFLTCGINPLSERALMLPATPDRRLYQCADGRHIAVACAEPRTWGALCDGAGVPNLKPMLHNPEHAAETTAVLAGIFRMRPASAWVEELTRLGATVTFFNHGPQLLDDPQIRARGAVVDVDGVMVPACPIRITDTTGAATRTSTAAPHNVGEDAPEILRAAGFSTEEIVAMEREGLI